MEKIFGEQNFVIGCNYWASHAGTSMWKDWRPDVVEADMAKLADAKMEVVRVFPMWPEFQPLYRHHRGNNRPYELRWPNNAEIPRDEDGCYSGVDPVMLERLVWFCDCAHRYGLKLGVGLVTGWMSGRIFAPPAFELCNLLRDPQVIRWQVRMVHRIVRALRNHPAVMFWGIGNECNCLDKATRDEGAMWASTIADAIRVEDNTHPILAGLHGLTAQPVASLETDGLWSIQDMGDIFDGLTTHPYPLFTNHCAVDGIKSMKSAFHATAESHYYGDIGHRPCIAEEVGTLAPTIAGKASAAKYINACLYNLWSHDCEGLLWWCGFDQMNLVHPPYQWCAVERQLGLFDSKGELKPVGQVFKDFAAVRAALPFKKLPKFQRDAVCVLTREQDAWMAAYGTWLLAKQAGFDIEFQYDDEPIRKSSLYLLPMIGGLDNLPRDRYLEIMHEVEENGATLYCSYDGACLAPFDEYFGATTDYREGVDGAAIVKVADGEELTFNYTARITLETLTAQVVLADMDGKPALICNDLGKGKVYFSTYSPERQVIIRNRTLEQGYWKLYSIFAADVIAARPVHSINPLVSVTINPQDEKTVYAVAVNHTDEDLAIGDCLAGADNAKVLAGAPEGRIAAHSAVVLQL